MQELGMTEDRRSGEDRRTHTRGGRRISDVEKTACPACGSRYSCVVDAKGERRRRQCECGFRYNTIERIENPISGVDAA
jgi:transcription elongation factor Elf1